MKGKVSLVDAFAFATVLWEHFAFNEEVACRIHMKYGFGQGKMDSENSPLPPDEEVVTLSMPIGDNGEEKIRIVSPSIGTMEICMLNGMTLWVRENDHVAYKYSEKKNELMAVAHGVLNRLIFEGIWEYTIE